MEGFVIYYIKIFIINLYIYYFLKMNNNNFDLKVQKKIKLLLLNFIICIISIYIKFYFNSFLSLIVFSILGSIVISINTNLKKRFILIEYGLNFIFLGLSIIIEFIPYSIFKINNNFINLIIILFIQYSIWKLFLKNKRMRNGFDYINQKINDDLIDIIIINICIAVILLYCLLGTIFNGIEEIRKNLLISFIILGITMFIMIQKTLTMHYKQKLLEDNLKFFENEVKEKEKEIENLKNEKYNISKITHEFFNRQKALELKVSEEMDNKELSKRIHNLNQEYMTEIGAFKITEKLSKTNIEEIDDMFRYMQSECMRLGIKFGLKIEGNIYYLINNIISKNKLETLIGDHIRDAINAVNREEIANKEILVILGIKEEKYELCILDTGVEFSINTLLKLGKENITTNKKIGGTGMGFITTFETMKKTGASLIIEEFENTLYTKSVKIRFDGKNEYKIISYRAQKIESKNTNRGDCIVIYK